MLCEINRLCECIPSLIDGLLSEGRAISFYRGIIYPYGPWQYSLKMICGSRYVARAYG